MLGVYLSIKTNSLTGTNISLFTVFLSKYSFKVLPIIFAQNSSQAVKKVFGFLKPLATWQGVLKGGTLGQKM